MALIHSNLPRPKRPVGGFVLGTALVLTAASAPIPFAQTAWANPSLRPRLVPTLTHARPTYYADARIPRVLEWPNPSVRPEPPLTWLQSRPVHAVDARIPRVLEWPNPLPRPRPALTWAQWRAPFYVDRGVDRTLEWPNPAPARRHAHTWTSNLLSSTLAPIPPRQTDWPNPEPRPAPGRSWLQSRPQYYQDTTIARAHAWTNPPRARGAAESWTQSLVTSTLAQAPSTDAPVAPIEWENPPIPARHPITWTQQRPIFAVDSRIDQVHAWPTPAEARRRAITWTHSLLGSTLAPSTAAPFVPVGWVNPQRLTAPTLTWIQTRPVYAVDERIVGVQAWATPQAAPRRGEAWTQTIPSTLSLEPGPKRQQEWPNPTMRAPCYWTHVSSSPLLLVLQPAAPFSQQPWQNPSRPRPVALSWTQDRRSHYTDERIPITLSWPLPMRGARRVQDWVSGANALLVPVRPSVLDLGVTSVYAVMPPRQTTSLTAARVTVGRAPDRTVEPV